MIWVVAVDVARADGVRVRRYVSANMRGVFVFTREQRDARRFEDRALAREMASAARAHFYVHRTDARARVVVVRVRPRSFHAWWAA